jgi:hypothetical protein
MQATALGKNYSLIGRVLKKAKPEVYMEIVDMLTPGEEIDVQKIYRFYAKYDQLEHVGEKVDRARVFVAVMIKLYYPYMLDKVITAAGHNFALIISTCFGLQRPHVSRMIPEAIVMYKCYDDFKIKVDEAFEKIKNGRQDSECGIE